MQKHSGWLIDVYEHPGKGVIVWVAGEKGKTRSFHHQFEITFYARGSVAQLHELGKFIRKKHAKEVVSLKKAHRNDLFDGPQEVMAIAVSKGEIFRKLTREVCDEFPDIIFYDIDIPFTVRYAATYNIFLMGRCEVNAQSDGRLISIKALDDPYDLDAKLPKLRILHLKPDTDPSHQSPKYLIIKYEKSFLRLPIDKPRELLSVLNGILSSFDPDVVSTYFGDSWLFPRLLKLAQETGIPFHPNRDQSLGVLRKKPDRFVNYGRAHYRAGPIYLRGRWHIDCKNTMTYNQYRLVGVVEQTRLSSLPAQEVARRSPGASISAMQILTALKRGILIPYQRQKAEIAKTFNEYYKAARGGLILQPRLGIYQNVASLDFSSKMASIMIRWNVSPETVVDISDKREGFEIPKLKLKILSKPGLIPLTLQPMRDRRLAFKRLLKTMDKDDPRYRDTNKRYQVIALMSDREAVVDAIKWLTVTCYGRLRFAMSVFGRLNSHEVVSYLSRTAILQAKRVAQVMGFDVLHLYIDSIFVCRHDAFKDDFQVLVDEIEKETGLPMEHENTYSWFAFLSSRENPNVSVSNKFFGVAENGKHKIRGVASRRGDTCAFVADIQREIIQILAKEKDSTKLAGMLPEALEMVQGKLSSLKNKKIPPEELVITQTLSRDLAGYSVLSPAAVAARQLGAHGKTVGMGQRIRFIYTSPGSSVYAWGLPYPLNPRTIDVSKYKELVLRASHEVLEPMGMTEAMLRNWLFHKAGYITPAGLLNSKDKNKLALPLFAEVDNLRVDRF